MIQIIVLVAAIAAPFLSYGWGRVQGKFETSAAVRAETKKQINQCNIRVEEIDRKHELAVVESVAAARAESSKIGETPVGPELQKLCDASPTCRSRRTK